MPLLWGLGGNIQAPVLFLTLCVSLPYIHTSLWLTWSEQGWEEALCSFSPLSAALNSPSASSPSLPYWPPITLPRLYPQNKTAGQGRAFLQVQTYRVKRWHIFWRNWAKGRRGGFGRGNINKGVLIWWSPVAHKEKWKRAKEKLLTIRALWMVAWRPKALFSEPECRRIYFVFL